MSIPPPQKVYRYLYGYGRLDVAAAVELALQPWEVTVVVTNTAGVPVAGLNLSWIDTRTGYTLTATTDVSGTVNFTPTLAGQYLLQMQGEVGTVEIDDLELVNDGIGGEAQTRRVDVLYDNLYPEKLYLPDINSTIDSNP